MLGRVGGGERPEHHHGREPQAREEAQREHHGFEGVARDVGVDGDGAELLLGLGAEELDVELRLGASTDALEEAQHDVGRRGGRRGGLARHHSSLSTAPSGRGTQRNSSTGSPPSTGTG